MYHLTIFIGVFMKYLQFAFTFLIWPQFSFTRTVVHCQQEYKKAKRSRESNKKLNGSYFMVLKQLYTSTNKHFTHEFFIISNVCRYTYLQYILRTLFIPYLSESYQVNNGKELNLLKKELYGVLRWVKTEDCNPSLKFGMVGIRYLGITLRFQEITANNVRGLSYLSQYSLFAVKIEIKNKKIHST